MEIVIWILVCKVPPLLLNEVIAQLQILPQSPWNSQGLCTFLLETAFGLNVTQQKDLQWPKLCGTRYEQVLIYFYYFNETYYFCYYMSSSAISFYFICLGLQDGKAVSDKGSKWISWTLVLNKLTSEDSGSYVCRASNSFGKNEFNIQLEITGI